MTSAEAALFLESAPELSDKVFAVPNGVDADYFAPHEARPNPYRAGELPIVFTGAMDYWPNVDAVHWFAHEAFPRIRRALPAARFYIVGMNPGPTVKALADLSGVAVTGRVDDVRPYLQHASVVVAPLRVARGVQNKVLEAMAMARPVVVSNACLSGLESTVGVEVDAADGAEDFAAKVIALAGAPRAKALGTAARARVLAAYDWNRNLDRIASLLETGRFAPEHAVHPAPAAA